jgi:hypothetical protein
MPVCAHAYAVTVSAELLRSANPDTSLWHQRPSAFISGFLLDRLARTVRCAGTPRRADEARKRRAFAVEDEEPKGNRDIASGAPPGNAISS